jgi:hypothetical protein
MESLQLEWDLEWRRPEKEEELLPGLVIAHALM